MNNFYHKKDGGVVLLDITNNILFVTTFGITKSSLRTGTGNISIKDSENSEPVFYCSQCEKNVPLDEIYSRCYYCGDEFPIIRLYRVSDSGGPYCDNCSREKFPSSSRNKLSTIFTKLSFRRI